MQQTEIEIIDHLITQPYYILGLIQNISWELFLLVVTTKWTPGHIQGSPYTQGAIVSISTSINIDA